ncbi:MAG: CoA transferase subunit A [Deltaproteobacteria bacterium]|nr:CoA transferase subunit A [Deltaproteobacteria bacterium]
MQAFGSKRKSKVMPLQEAAKLVEDGMMLGIGGVNSHMGPSAFSRELIRRGVKDLTIIPTNNTGYQTDILLGAGCVKSIYTSYVGLDYIGAAPNFRRLAETGKLDVVEFDEMGLLRGLKASAAGLNFFPLPGGMRGVDAVRANPEFFREVEDPFTGEKVVVVPPIRPDISVLHVPKCDAYGNARETGHVQDLLHFASNRVIVTTEEVVSLEDTQAHYTEVTVFGRLVDAVVEVPYGAHPGECHGCYQMDEAHLKDYAKAGKDEATFREYLDEYVYSVKTHEEYLEKIGIAGLLSKLKYY